MDIADEEEEFLDFIMKIYIDLLKSLAKKDANLLPPSESLAKGIVDMWNVLSGNLFSSFIILKFFCLFFLECKI